MTNTVLAFSPNFEILKSWTTIIPVLGKDYSYSINLLQYCNNLFFQNLKKIPRLLPWVYIWVKSNFFSKFHMMIFFGFLITNAIKKLQYFENQLQHCNIMAKRNSSKWPCNSVLIFSPYFYTEKSWTTIIPIFVEDCSYCINLLQYCNNLFSSEFIENTKVYPLGIKMSWIGLFLKIPYDMIFCVSHHQCN